MNKFFFLITVLTFSLTLGCNDVSENFIKVDYDKAVIFYKEKDYDTSLEILNEGLEFESSVNEIVCRAYYLRGFIHNLNNNSRLAYDDYLKALEIARTKSLSKLIGMLNNEIGQIFFENELYDQAYVYFKLALDNAGDSPLGYKGNYLYGVAKSLREKKEFEESLKYYFQTIDLREQLQDYTGYVNATLGLGILQSKAGNYDQAIIHFQEVIELSHLTKKSNRNKFKAYNNIGNAYLLQKDYEQAIIHLNKSLDHESDNSDLAVTYNDLGKVYNGLGKYRQAWNNFKKSLEFNKKKVEINELAITNEALKKTFSKLNQPDSLLHYTIMINDMALPRLQTKSWLKDEERKIALLTKYQDYIQKKAEQEKYAQMMWFSVWVLASLIVAGLLGYKLWRIYHYQSPVKGHMLVKNQHEMAYLLDMFRNEKEEMKKVMEQKMGG